ncbi:MAG: hypothetical protein HGA61_00900 [Candidatus Moranbacteria bacterium]|nr:hypothetical protein [Candidatus Moranbacteria bacterium]
MKKLESFFWGIIAACGAAVFQLIYFLIFSDIFDTERKFSFVQFYSVPFFIIIIAFIEEFFKYLILSKRISKISSKKSFFLNAFFMGLGFFCLELALILNKGLGGELREAVVEILILQIGTTVLLGFFVANEKMKKSSSAIFGLFLATLFHSTFNLLALDQNHFTDYGSFVLLATLFFICLKISFTSKATLAKG